MKISFKKSADQKDKILIIPLFEEKLNEEYIPAELKDWLKLRAQRKDFNAKTGQVITYFPTQPKSSEKIFLMGLGNIDKINGIEIRNAVAGCFKHIVASGDVHEVSLLTPNTFMKYGQEIGEAFALANYQYAKYKTGKAKAELEKKNMQQLNFIVIAASSGEQKTFKLALEKGLSIGDAVNFVRDLVNGPPNIMTIDYVADQAKEVASKNRYKIKVLDKKQLEKLKMGALLGVNKGSHLGAKLVVMEHLPLGRKEKPIVLVGKGIIYDTGGYNLKPTPALDWMHMDMAGAAVVLGTMSLLKKLNIKKNVIGVFPLTDNVIDANAQKPGDIVTSYAGKTIEIGNTDAEGRLVLADAISYAVESYDVQAVIDLATLTGACRIALGERYAGLFGNNKDLKKKLNAAGKEVDELVWPMPIHSDHHRAMKSKIADLNNIDLSGLAGASTGAAFIEEFVEKKPWVHLDIAGVTNVKNPKKYETTGATGYGVRLLIKFLEQ